MTLKSRFMMNHVGFLPNASKCFAYQGESSEFEVSMLQDLQLIPLMKGVLVPHGGEYKTGDFSEITREGIYRICTEEGNSRCFIISRDAYGTVARTLTNYFTWQRCGDDMGWHGRCHSEDSITLKNGEMRMLAGGHHQSSDLRKWSYGTSIGIAGLAEYALREKPLWDKGRLAEELWHSADYYLSLITEEGWLIDCTWVPEGYDTARAGIGYGDYAFSWKKRQYFESPDNEQAHWQVMKALALTSEYFKRTDSEKYNKCLAGAEKLWRYMNGKGKEMSGYKVPLYPPLGHDKFQKIFQGFYEGSALRYASRAEAACKLFRASGKETYKESAFESLNQLCRLQVGGNVAVNPAAACFWESSQSDILANNYYYVCGTNIPMAYVDVLELWPEAENASIWTGCMEKIAEQYSWMSAENPFGRIPAEWHTKNHNVFEEAAVFSFSTNTKPVKHEAAGGSAKHNGRKFEVVCEYYSFCYNLDLIAAGIFLLKAAGLTGKVQYREIAQRQLDWILGGNQFDASSVEGVGYNQPHRGIFGEFFPPVPQIPGAVFTGITEESFEEEAFGYDCEYDMPMAGWLLYLIAVNDEE